VGTGLLSHMTYTQNVQTKFSRNLNIKKFIHDFSELRDAAVDS
jgi:hypothetical protein